VSSAGYLKPYLDSSVYIAWLNREVVDGVDRHAVARHILDAAAAGQYQIYCSALTLVEVNKILNPAAAPMPVAEDDALLRYFENDFFEFIPVDRGIAEAAHRLCRRNAIKPADAIHLASALRAHCDVLLSWDRPLNKIVHGAIRLEEPRVIGQTSLNL
jgi:predicted nucleic acid-binding protein